MFLECVIKYFKIECVGGFKFVLPFESLLEREMGARVDGMEKKGSVPLSCYP